MVLNDQCVSHHYCWPHTGSSCPKYFTLTWIYLILTSNIYLNSLAWIHIFFWTNLTGLGFAAFFAPCRSCSCLILFNMRLILKYLRRWTDSPSHKDHKVRVSLKNGALYECTYMSAHIWVHTLVFRVCASFKQRGQGEILTVWPRSDLPLLSSVEWYQVWVECWTTQLSPSCTRKTQNTPPFSPGRRWSSAVFCCTCSIFVIYLPLRENTHPI